MNSSSRGPLDCQTPDCERLAIADTGWVSCREHATHTRIRGNLYLDSNAE